MRVSARLAAALVAVAVPLLAGFQASEARAAEELLESRESVYNNIYVLKRGDLVIMQFGKNQRFWTESIYDSSDAEALPVDYTRYLTGALAYPPKVESLLEIGLGGGRTASYLDIFMPELSIHSVELDPVVIEMAEEYFDVRPGENFTVEAVDGRIHLMRSRTQHDVILVDAYRGPFVPFHMLTREFYQLAKERLAEGGVLAQNIEPSTMLFDSAVATLASVFDNLDFYPSSGNVVAIAYDGESRDQQALLARAAELQAEYGFRYPLPEMVENRHLLTAIPDAEPLIDDFAPVEMLKSIERHNKGVDEISRPVSGPVSRPQAE